MKLKQPNIKGLDSINLIKKDVKVTPMISQYLEVKERHKNYLLFYRMGDFYELFFEDAKIAANELGIALTKRGKLGDEDIPMCGVPAHAAQNYLSRLIGSGFKVAVAEQLEGVENTTKKSYQKIFKRDVVRIITPGTILEDNLLDSKSYNNLLSVAHVKGEISLTWIDMTTGDINLQRISGSELKQDFYEAIKKVNPCEIICNNDIKHSSILQSLLNPFQKKITEVASSFFDHKNNITKIKNYFKNNELSGLGDLNIADISSVGALINYIELTQKENVPLVKNLNIINPEKFMQIDDFSFNSLEIFKKTDGEKSGSLISVIDKTNTPLGGRLLKEYIKFPLIEIEEIKKRHDLVKIFIDEINLLTSLRNFLKETPDVERAISRITANINNPRDLIIVLNFLKTSQNIFKILKDYHNKKFKTLYLEESILKKLLNLENLIEKTINPNTPNIITNGDVINAGVEPELDRLRDIKNIKKEEIVKLQLDYIKETEVGNLKIKFNNIHGYFIEVTNKNSSKLIESKGKIFNLIQNTVNASRFQTPELLKLTKDIQESEFLALELEQKIYKDLCKEIRSASTIISLVAKKIAYIDVIANFAHISKTNNYVKPKLEEKIKIIEIVDGRHPIVEESLKKDALNFIPNNCSMDDKNSLWLMTGPNMAGKSTFLRQTAIIILMNQIGCFVPASSASLSIFDKIFTRIGASDNLAKGMSTFMMEMVETSRIINNASESSFVILDELGRGTSTQDGLAIAQSVLEYIFKKINCLTLFATHYKELCKITEHISEIKLKTLEIKRWKNEIIFLYKVVDGISEGSFGIHVAKLAGLKTNLIERSREILSSPSDVNEKNFELDLDVDDSQIESKEKNEDIINFIKDLNADEISPKDALDILYTLKKNFID